MLCVLLLTARLIYVPPTFGMFSYLIFKRNCMIGVEASCKLAQVGEGKPTSFVGLAPSPDRAELHSYSAVSLSSGNLLPFILYPENLPTV